MEILVVVALIAILATITFIAINPAQNFQDTRNTQRSSHVGQILNAVSQYLSEEGNTVGDFTVLDDAGVATAMPACGVGVAIIGDTPVAASGDVYADLDNDLVDQYIVGIPVDPQTGDAADTGYTICEEGSGRITIAAPDAEDGEVISVSR